ncbi:MAG: hypothetical protein RMJ30_00605 [Nitrososphaerota archaeon]|nr:hypothetical protein [Nitrososphaerota archaeon]
MNSLRLGPALTLLVLLLVPSVSAENSPLPPGEPEDLAIAVAPSGHLMVSYIVAYPMSSLAAAADAIRDTTEGSAVLLLNVRRMASNGTAFLEVAGQPSEARVNSIVRAFASATGLRFETSGSTGQFIATVTWGDVVRTVEALKPATVGGFSPNLRREFLERFEEVTVVVSVSKMRWGVTTSLEVRLLRQLQFPSGAREHVIDVLRELGVSDLRPARGAMLNVILMPPFGAQKFNYEVTPRSISLRPIAEGVDAHFAMLNGSSVITSLRFGFTYAFGSGALRDLPTDFLTFVERIERAAALVNRTSTPLPAPTTPPGQRPVPSDEGTEEAPETETPDAGTVERAPAGGPMEALRRVLPPIEGAGRTIQIDPLHLLVIVVSAASFLAFASLYVRGRGPSKKGAASLVVVLLITLSLVLPIMAISAVRAERASGGLESILEVEQFHPGGAPSDLEIPLLFPGFKRIDKVSKTFISFEEINVVATPGLHSPYVPQGFEKLLATLGMDLRLIQMAGLIFGGGLNPLGMFKGMTVAHGATSVFLVNEDVGANVFVTFKAKPSGTLKSLLNVINTVYRIGYALYHSTICFPGDGCLHPIGWGMMVASSLAAVALALIAPGFMVYALASYPVVVNNELYATFSFKDGKFAEDEERLWLAEERYMVSLAILIMILRAPTLSGWRGAEGLTDIPLTASFHVTSDADSGWRLTDFLGIYSGDRGLKVTVDFKDALGIFGLFESLFGLFQGAWSSLASHVAGSLSEQESVLRQIAFELRSLVRVNALLDSPVSKLDRAVTLLADARLKLGARNCQGAQQNVDGARASIRSAIQDLQPLVSDSGLGHLIRHYINELEKVEASLSEYTEQLDGLCAPYNFSAEPPTDPESIPDERKLTLTFIVLSATPMVTEAVHYKTSSTLSLRAYWGWNPLPGIAYGLERTVREIFRVARLTAYNALDRLDEAVDFIASEVAGELTRPLNALVGGLIGGPLGDLSGALSQILGPIRSLLEGVRGFLTGLKDAITGFLDNIVNQIRNFVNLIKQTITSLVNQLVSAISGLISSVVGALLGPIMNMVSQLFRGFGLLGDILAGVIRDMITNFVNELISGFVQEILNGLMQPVNQLINGLDQLVNRILEPINRIKEALTRWHDQIVSTIDRWLGDILNPLNNVLSVAKSDLANGQISGLVTAALREFLSGMTRPVRESVEEAVRKLNEAERKILGSLIRIRDSMIHLNNMLRVPIIGRGGVLQATIADLGESAASDDYGRLGSITIDTRPLKLMPGWYHQYEMVLHPVGGGPSAPIPADFTLLFGPLEEIRELFDAPPPSVVPVKVNEIGPALRGWSVDVVILGDPKRPVVPGASATARLFVVKSDGTVEVKGLGDLTGTLIAPFCPFPIENNPLLAPFCPWPIEQGPMIAPFVPFPIERETLIAPFAPWPIEGGPLLSPFAPWPIEYSVGVLETPYNDPSARAVPRILVPADTMTGPVLISPFVPFPIEQTARG